uniref:L1 transposable element RRM domain-containing protein n=1 Tax=Myotis myotis TaxID=51298 RepID=A0A7J7XZP8_MYOMY|nr:hypothetical protein mMyoMyo1_011401 [Myotis myotis]
MKQSNIYIIGVPEPQEEVQGLEKPFEEIMTEHFPDLGEKNVTQAQRVPNKMNSKRSTPRHVVITMANINDKARILKAARDRELPTQDLPLEYQTHQARRKWNEVYKVMQSKGMNPRILYPARLSLKK